MTSQPTYTSEKRTDKDARNNHIVQFLGLAFLLTVIRIALLAANGGH